MDAGGSGDSVSSSSHRDRGAEEDTGLNVQDDEDAWSSLIEKIKSTN